MFTFAKTDNQHVMKKKIWGLLVLMVLGIVTSCSKGDDGPIPDPKPNEKEIVSVSVSQDSYSVSQDGGSFSLSFKVTGASWSISASEKWLSVSSTSGTAGSQNLTVQVNANETVDDRSASITIKAGTESKTVSVMQKQKDALILTANALETDKDKALLQIEVQANIDYTYSILETCADWIHAVDTRALQTTAIVLEVDENTSEDCREGFVVIESGIRKDTVSILQYGTMPAIRLAAHDYQATAESSSFEVACRSNVPVEVIMPKVDWIKRIPATRSTSSLRFEIEQNDTYDDRSADIILTDADRLAADTIHIFQQQKKGFLVENPSLSIDANGGLLNVQVSANVDYVVSSSANWIHTESTRSLKDSTLTLRVDENTTQEAREATVTLSNGNLEVVVKVTQKASYDFGLGIGDLGVTDLTNK